MLNILINNNTNSNRLHLETNVIDIIIVLIIDNNVD